MLKGVCKTFSRNLIGDDLRFWSQISAHVRLKMNLGAPIQSQISYETT